MGFANLFKAMAWRLAKGRMGKAFAAVYALLIVGGVVALKAIGADASISAAVSETSSDVALGLSVLSPGSGGVDLMRACGALFVRGSFVAMLVAVFCGLFFAKDVRSGGVKNIVQGRTARRDYALAAGVLTLAVAAFAVLAGALVSVVSLAALGFPLAALAPGELVSWLAEVWLAVSAYAVVVVVVALLTGSEAVSVVAGLMLGGAAVENLLYAALGLVTGHPDEVRQVFGGYLAMMLSRLGDGTVLLGEAVVPALATVAIAVAAGALVMRRRRLA